MLCPGNSFIPLLRVFSRLLRDDPMSRSHDEPGECAAHMAGACELSPPLTQPGPMESRLLLMCSVLCFP